MELEKVMEPPQATDSAEPITARPDFSSDEEDVVDPEKVEKKQLRKKKKGKKKKAKQMVYSGTYFDVSYTSNPSRKTYKNM